jgi:hypothetical protein
MDRLFMYSRVRARAFRHVGGARAGIRGPHDERLRGGYGTPSRHPWTTCSDRPTTCPVLQNPCKHAVFAP